MFFFNYLIARLGWIYLAFMPTSIVFILSPKFHFITKWVKNYKKINFGYCNLVFLCYNSYAFEKCRSSTTVSTSDCHSDDDGSIPFCGSSWIKSILLTEDFFVVYFSNFIHYLFMINIRNYKIYYSNEEKIEYFIMLSIFYCWFCWVFIIYMIKYIVVWIGVVLWVTRNLKLISIYMT